MIKISQPIVVEGKYDRIKLASVVEATIIETGGFRIFHNKEMLQTIRTLAAKTGIIIMTDSDAAGFKIRNYLTGCIKDGKIINVYIPELAGKERRKTEPSAQGLLGVEGVDKDILLAALKKAGVSAKVVENPRPITKLDLFELGLNGQPDSRLKRELLLKKLDLPGRISTNAMLTILNSMISYDQLVELRSSLDLGESQAF